MSQRFEYDCAHASFVDAHRIGLDTAATPCPSMRPPLRTTPSDMMAERTGNASGVPAPGSAAGGGRKAP